MGGSFLDTLLVAATGQLKTSGTPLVTSGQSVVAVPGQLVLCDPTVGTLSVSAPTGPSIGTVFGVADVTGQSAVHAISVLSSGGSFQLESPATPGTYSNSVTIASASRVRFWIYVGPSPGWKLLYGVF
jgi:hypothetical protein